MPGSADVPDVTRLRAFAEMMREEGMTRLILPDGTVLERPPPTALEQAMSVARRPQAGGADDDDEDEVLAEEKAKRALERAWDEKWRTVMAASGGAIPPFPEDPALAKRFVGGDA